LEKIKAIITVSLQGLSVDMDPILELAKEKGMYPIAEDLQKKIMQFKTNYKSLSVAQGKADIMKALIDKLGRVK
jgi:dTDP-4-amino-4,6-dideoxygalactose transaminase